MDYQLIELLSFIDDDIENNLSKLLSLKPFFKRAKELTFDIEVDLNLALTHESGEQ